MADDSWNAHQLSQNEVRKMEELADRLGNMIPDLESEQKICALRELVYAMRQGFRY